MKEQKIANQITLSGCDDKTEIWFEITRQEEEFLARLALALNDASSYGCQPQMYLNGELLETPKTVEDEE